MDYISLIFSTVIIAWTIIFKRKHKLPIILCVYLVEVSQGLLFSHEHLGKLGALLWVQPHHIPQQENVVGSVANLLGIQNDLLVLASLSKTLDHLYG